MTGEIARYEGRRRLRGSLALSAGIAVLTGLYLWMFPTISAGIDLDEYVRSLPPALRAAFGLEALGTIEGFLAAELYAFVWVILLAIYLAYAGASLVAGEVETDRIDLLLALPITRRRLLAEKVGALAVPLVTLNVVVPVVVYLGAAAIGESLSAADLAAVHLLSVPYLATAAGVGVLCSVVFDRTSVAQRVAMAVVFGLFMVDSAVTGTDVAWLGAVAPSRYYEPTDVLVRGEYDLVGAGLLVLAAVVLFGTAAAWFSRRDIA